jgi:hypothetical protein
MSEKESVRITFNSPYGVVDHGDVQVHTSSLPLASEIYISQRNGNQICRWCFYGLHSHAPRTKDTEYGGFADEMDCKVILTKDGNTAGQCCCTWYRE